MKAGDVGTALRVCNGIGADAGGLVASRVAEVSVLIGGCQRAVLPLLLRGRQDAGCPEDPACCGWRWQRRSGPRTWRPYSEELCPSRSDPWIAFRKEIRIQKGYRHSELGVKWFLLTTRFGIHICTTVLSQCQKSWKKKSFFQSPEKSIKK